MNTSLVNNLQIQYPRINMDRLRDLSIGPGWYELLNSLLSTIDRHLENQQLNKLPVTKINLIQIKEKFGGMRFYYDGGDDTIHGMVLLAETLSTKTCDVCGRPGKIRSDLGWIRTLCDEHHMEQKRLEEQ